MYYEIINPSDMVTCVSDDDKIAYACCILVSNGNYGCTNLDTQESLNCLFLFASTEQFEDGAAEYLKMPFGDFIEANRTEIKKCLKSWAYGSAEDRITFDSVQEFITEPEKLKEFRNKHEDRNRTSMSRIVARAWQMADQIKD